MQTSLRDVAREAKVDPALIIRYFGSKEALFLEAATFQPAFEHVFSGSLDQLGERLVAHLIGLPQEARNIYVALYRASDSVLVQDRLRFLVTSLFVAPLSMKLNSENVELRSHLIAAQVGGLLSAISLYQDEVIAGADEKILIRLYGQAIQSLIG